MRSGRDGPGDGLRGEARRVAERVSAVVADREPSREHGRDHPDELLPERGPGPLERLAERLPVRIDPGRRAAVAVALVVVLAAVLTGLWVLSSRPRSMPVSAAAPSIAGASPLVTATGDPSASGPPLPTAASNRASGSSAVSEVVVDVAGKVRRPGLYRLPPGSRVDDAIKAAGGANAGVDLTSLNLAAPLVDGQQIAVGRPGAAQQPAGSAPTSGGGSASTGSGGPVNLNTATLEQLEDLPGIGPALAQRILDYRTEHGSFGSVDQLDDVSGIGTVIFARLKPLVTV